MSTTFSTGCLSFFTANHPTHAKQWLQNGDQFTLVCFACLVEIIENKSEPSIRKAKTLQEILKLISNGEVLSLLDENENVSSHLLRCLWELMDYEETKTQQITAVEIVHHLCCGLKSEQFLEKVVEQIAMKLVSSDNVKKVSPQLDLLGKLIQNIPALVSNLIRRRMNVVSYLGRWTAYPDESTRSLLFFILTHFYRHPEGCSEIPLEVTDTVFRECCEVLTTATSKELQINSVALLQSLTAKDSSSGMSKTIIANKDRVITSLKKAFLSSVELVQTIAIGCLDNLVEFDESIISSDLPGFIFEVFNSRSDTLLSLGLHSVSRFLENKEMYTKGHVVYGFDAVLSALQVAAYTKSTKVLRQGFDVLRKIFENSPQELVLISSKDILMKCLDVINKVLLNADDHVVLRGISCLSTVLDGRHYGCDVPYGQLVDLVEMVVRRLEKICRSSGHWSRVENKDLKSSTIAAILEVISKSLDLVICGRNKPPSIETLLASTQDSIMLELDDFLNNILKLCDQICIPQVISNLRDLRDPAVPELFFKVLNKLLLTCSGDCKEMAQKFVSSCFIRIAIETKTQHPGTPSGVQRAINDFLETICCCLVPNDMRDYVKNLLCTSLQRVNGTVQELLQVLKQNHSKNETLRNTQECIQTLFYLAYTNGDRLTSGTQLLHALSTFLVLNPTCYSHGSAVISRCLTQLFIEEICRNSGSLNSSPLYANAQRILADELLKNINNLSRLYFHDSALLEWAVAFQELDPDLRKEIIELWFIHESEKDMSEEEMSFWRRMVEDNHRVLLTLVSILSTARGHALNSLLKLIEHVLQSCDFVIMKQVLQELKQALQKLFLNQVVEPLPNENMESILKLLCLLVTTCSTAVLDEDYVKLVYHVVNFLTHHANSSGLSVRCLNFLNACIIQDTKHGSDKVLSFLLNHHEYNSFLEKAIHVFHNSSELQRAQQGSTVAAVLVTISNLLHLQHKFGISTKNSVHVEIEAVLPLLCYTSNPLLQFAANVFWESVLSWLKSTKLFDSNLVLLSEENAASEGSRCESGVLSKVHLSMILVCLQNSLLHVNMFIKMTALRCLEGLFSLSGRSMVEFVDRLLRRNME